jgi:hypothetical protein
MDSAPLPHITLIEHRRLVDLVIERIVPRDTPGMAIGWRSRHGPFGDFCRDLAKRIYQQWERLIALADPRIRYVQQAVYIHGESQPPLLHERALYKHRYLRFDIGRYPAAAQSVPIAYELAELRDLNLSARSTSPASGFYFAPQARRSIPPTEELVELLAIWQDLYSPSCRAYRSLRRTLMHFQGGVPSKLLVYLAQFTLERPILNRAELLTLLLAQSQLPTSERNVERLRPFMFASRRQILDGLRDVGEYLGQPLVINKMRDVGTFVRLILDSPAGPRDLPTAVRRAIRWHREECWRNALSSRSDLGTPTHIPRIPLPQESNIRFLASIGDIVAESVEMNHCIATYAAKAVRGECFLFHVEYEHEHASVEVDPGGHVRQAHGPRNSQNRACEYGRRVLKLWARGLHKAVEA